MGTTSEQKKASYQRHRVRILAKRQWHYDNEPIWRERHLQQKRESLLRVRYGVTPREYARLLLLQGGSCAVCKTKDSRNGKSKVFDVDHDHDTGKVRGLLCRKYNVTAGVLERNRERISKIEEYLKLHAEYDPK